MILTVGLIVLALTVGFAAGYRWARPKNLPDFSEMITPALRSRGVCRVVIDEVEVYLGPDRDRGARIAKEAKLAGAKVELSG